MEEQEKELTLAEFMERAQRRCEGFDGGPMPELVSWDEEQQQAIFRYLLPKWMCNGWGVVHGGMTAAVVDTAFGIVSCWKNSGMVAPTTSMHTDFLRSVKPEIPFEVHITLERMGRVVGNLTAKCWQEGRVTTICTTSVAVASPRRMAGM